MAKQTVEKITVEFISQYGSLKVGDEWLSPKKGVEYTFQKGKTYDVLTEPWSARGKSGRNIVAVLGESGQTTTTTPPPVAGRATQEAPKDAPNVFRTKKGNEYVKAGFGKPMTAYEIELDRRISRAGLIQAAVSSPALAVLPAKTVADVAKNAKALFDEMLKIVEEDDVAQEA